jgi:hypothetical protein
LGIPAVGLALFAEQVIRKRSSKFKTPYIWIVAFFVAFSILSALLNGLSAFALVYFFVYVFLAYLYFLTIINETSNTRVDKVVKFVVLLILFQIPAVFAKYLLLGQSEHGAIGTISVVGGSISTVFPLLIIAFLIALYFYRRQKIFLILILCYILFGLIGAKRAIVFLIPLELLLAYLLFLKQSHRIFKAATIKYFVVVAILALTGFYVMVKTSPSLNPENSNWGSFDLAFLINYTIEYTTDTGGGQRGMRRTEGLVYFTTMILKSNWYRTVLGDGAGNLVQSQYESSSGTMLDKYGVRYGGRMGIIWLLLQVGIVGALLYISLIMMMVTDIQKNVHPVGNDLRALKLGFMVATVFMFFDFFFYSTVFLKTEAIKSVYFFAAALLYRIKT